MSLTFVIGLLRDTRALQQYSRCWVRVPSAFLAPMHVLCIQCCRVWQLTCSACILPISAPSGSNVAGPPKRPSFQPLWSIL